MRRGSLGAGVLLGIVLTGATGVATAKEVGPPAVWTSKEGAPAWVTAPPAKADAIRVVVAAQSNVLELADHLDPGYVRRQVQAEIAWRLRALLSADADLVLSVPLQPTFVQKAYHLDPPPRGATFPGAQTYTVWTLFEVPLEPAVQWLPAERRAAARAWLVPGTPGDAPPWEESKAAPLWSAPRT